MPSERGERWTTTIIDAAGTFLMGRKFTVRELSQAIAKDPRFRTCLSGALADVCRSGPTRANRRPYLDDLGQPMQLRSGFDDLLTRIVASTHFVSAGGEPAPMGGI